MNKKIPVFSIEIGQNEKKYINDCLDTSWIGQGGYVTKFEDNFSSYVDCKFGITTTSGTTALHLALVAAGVKDGDEVIVSSSTNMACAFSIAYCNAIPVPIDIEKDSWVIDVNLIEKKITKKTKALMVVHLFGQTVDMDPVMEIAKKYDLKVIEDCAEAHGVDYKGRKVGSIGDLGCFSFFSNKTITCGEGGMVVTNSENLAERSKSYKNLCYGKINKFIHDDIGFNYRLPNISAAMGVGQLEQIDEIINQKDRIYKRYSNNLKNISGLNIPKITKHTTKFIMWVFNIYLDSKFKISRDSLVKFLSSHLIETRNGFVPINYQKCITEKYNVNESDCPNANYIMDNGLYLPSGNNISNEEIDFVCEKIIESNK
jgi:perosamine synthetase